MVGMIEHKIEGRTLTRLDELQAISRARPLTPRETVHLDLALRRRGQRKGQRYWTRSDINRLRRYLLRGKKPAQIAPLMNRTERAIWRKMYKLGWTVGDADKCSIALPPAT